MTGREREPLRDTFFLPLSLPLVVPTSYIFNRPAAAERPILSGREKKAESPHYYNTSPLTIRTLYRAVTLRSAEFFSPTRKKKEEEKENREQRCRFGKSVHASRNERERIFRFPEFPIRRSAPLSIPLPPSDSETRPPPGVFSGREKLLCAFSRFEAERTSA